MKRREFIRLLGGAAAWPLAARAQQQAVSKVGYLDPGWPRPNADMLAALREGLSESGYIDGQNLAIEERWAEDQYERLPGLAVDLVREPVSVLVAIATRAAFAAIAATTTTPIVFVTGNDPVDSGLVASINRPGANVTGASTFEIALAPKRMELLRELVPKAVAVALLIHPSSPTIETSEAEARSAARSLGISLTVLKAGTEREIEGALAGAVEKPLDALVIVANPVFLALRQQIAALAARLMIPTIYPNREFMAAGGLMSYGSSVLAAYHQAGVYAGRILKGEKPGDLPVMQPSKFELVINIKMAKALGLPVPLTLQYAADEVIE